MKGVGQGDPKSSFQTYDPSEEDELRQIVEKVLLPGLKAEGRVLISIWTCWSW